MISEGVNHNITLPHARLYAMRGHPIRRVSWSARWWVYVAGSIWLEVSESGSALVEAADLSADFLARDWTIWGSASLAEPESVTCDLAPMPTPPPFRVRMSNLDCSSPLFDLTRPPCGGVRLSGV